MVLGGRKGHILFTPLNSRGAPTHESPSALHGKHTATPSTTARAGRSVRTPMSLRVPTLAAHQGPPSGGDPAYDRNLVDPASSHTLVSKIKPCMSKYKPLYGETANGSLYQL